MEHTPFRSQETVGERLKQTFYLYKKNFVPLSILVFFYNVIALVVSLGIWNKAIEAITLGVNPGQEVIGFFTENLISTGIIISLGITGFLLYMIFYIPVLVATIKSIRDTIHEKQVDVMVNLKYGFLQFWNVLKVYWYIFQYVFLTPALILISGLLVVLLALITGIGTLFTIAGLLVFASFFVCIVYMAYRGLRSTFRLYSAIDTEDFSKENFQAGLKETKGKVWRLFGNFLLLGFLIGIFTGILGALVGAITGVNPDLKQAQLEQKIESGELSFDDIAALRSDMGGREMFHGILATLIETLGIVFGTIFGYIFYLRIKDEHQKNSPEQENMYKSQDEEEISTVV